MPRRSDSSLDETALARLLKEQDGVVSHSQLASVGASRADVRRLLRSRRLVPVHPGVYVDHTGRPTRRQRQWAAVLLYAPAALHRESALDAHGMTRDRSTLGETIHLVVGAHRRLTPVPGVVIERVADVADRVQQNRRPPRASFDYALLKSASSLDEASAVALMSDAVHQGLTTSPRLLAELETLPRLPRRAVLGEILRDVAAGSRSVLERRYLHEVERAHGLPIGSRQLRHDAASGTTYRDVAYSPYDALVEIDGAFRHRDAVDRWADLGRDLDAVVQGRVTLRPGWAQVLEPCRLAAIVATVLQARGWAGRPVACGPGCVIADDGADDGAEGPI